MNKIPKFLAILAIAVILCIFCGVAMGCEKTGEKSQAPTATPLPLTPIATRTYTPTPQNFTEKELKSEVTAMGIRKVGEEYQHVAGECAVGEEAYITLRLTNDTSIRASEIRVEIWSDVRSFLDLFLTDSCESYEVIKENGKETLVKASDGTIVPPSGGLFSTSTTYFRFTDDLPAGGTRLYVLRFTAKQAKETSFYLKCELLAPDGNWSRFESSKHNFKVLEATSQS